MINVNKLSFDYPGKRALDHLSFQIAPNTITALVGPNGAGKTTLLRCLSALDTPTIGTITIDGIDAERFPRKIHQAVSYLPDLFGLYENLTVEQNLIFFAKSHLVPLDKVQERVIATANALQISEYLTTAAGKLSRGLRQRLAIGIAVIHQPKILMLDEPASGLDPEARFHLSKLLVTLQKNGMTLIVSSHILSELEDYSTDMIILNEGKIVNQSGLNQQKRDPFSSVQLVIEFTQDPAPYRSIIESFENVKVESTQEKSILIRFKGPAEDQHLLLKSLIEKNLPVCALHEEKESLQEVYLNITKGQNK